MSIQCCLTVLDFREQILACSEGKRFFQLFTSIPSSFLFPKTLLPTNLSWSESTKKVGGKLVIAILHVEA